MFKDVMKFYYVIPGLGILIGGLIALLLALIGNLEIGISIIFGGLIGFVIGSIIYSYKKK